MKITLEFTPEQLEAITEALAVKMGGPPTRNPLTIAEFAREIGRSWPYVKSRVEAGIITKLPDPGDTLIPYSELERYRSGKPS